MTAAAMFNWNAVLRFARRVCVHAVLAGVVTLLLLAPDYLAQKVILQTSLLFPVKYFWIFSGFAACLLLIRSNRIILAVLALLMCLQVTQFISLVYFKDYLSPLVIGLFGAELSEILNVAQHEAAAMVYAPAAVVASFALIAVIALRTTGQRLTLPYAPLLVVVYLGIVPFRILSFDDPIRFFPVAATPTLMNTLNAYALYATVLLPQDLFEAQASSGYAPYRVTRSARPPAGTVVVIMGESLSSRRMGLLGHSRPTTPHLSELQREGRLIAMPAISSGVSTRASLPLFFNLLREPANADAILTQTTNLFRLAKRQGYHTAYVSAQKSNLLTGIGTRYIDDLVTKDFHEAAFAEKRDDAILDFLDGMDLSKPTFLVLHERALHAPAELSYGNHPEFERYEYQGLPPEQRTRNAYDNGVLYYDWFISEIFRRLSARARKPLYVFVTADHGEEMGEEGRFGHSHLTLNSARIPFMLYAEGADPAFLRTIRAMVQPTHYEVGLAIAKLLGFAVQNPNEEPGRFYINGPKAFGVAGMLEIRKPPGAAPKVKRLLLRPALGSHI